MSDLGEEISVECTGTCGKVQQFTGDSGLGCEGDIQGIVINPGINQVKQQQRLLIPA